MQILITGLSNAGIGFGINPDNFAANPDGAVLNAEGVPAQRLFAMGPPLRGQWWESTAVTDVAAQAKALAQRLMQ